MVKLDGNKIHMTRGDSLEIGVMIDGYVPVSGDKVTFRLKDRALTGGVLFEKSISPTTMMLKIDPDDTKNLEPQIYRYEIELVKSGGFTSTIIEWEVFELGKEIGR